MARLPDRLDPRPDVVWRRPLSQVVLAGVAATRDVVVVADRDVGDTQDVFHCLAADSGKELWTVRYRALGKLDYGNSSRSTPLVDSGRVFLAGAHGHVQAVALTDGAPLWQRHLPADYGIPPELKWGYCASPLLLDGKLIIHPGMPNAALVALDPATGKELWKSPGRPPGYGSLVAGRLGGRLQIVGHDAERLTGWDPDTGKELWSVEPELPGDFNVPTPSIVDGTLVVATEGNGTRRFAFDSQGLVIPKPIAIFPQLAPGTHSPIAAGGRLFGVHEGLYCLGLSDGLKLNWKGRDKAFQEHTSLLATSDRLLIATSEAELILVDAQASKFQILGRMRVLPDEGGLLSYPAVVDDRLYLRGSHEIVCIRL